MSVLETLGWAPSFDAEFEQHRHNDLIPGRVAAQHRGEYVLFTEEGELRAEPSGALRHDAVTSGDLPATGDWVAASSHDGRATIHAVLTRRTAFVRRAAGERPEEQVLAANVDVAFLLAGLDGDFNPRRLERFVATAWESGAAPVIVLTKRDLCDDVELRVTEAESVATGIPVHAVATPAGEGVDELRRYLDGNRTVALLGSSGVGKSTLVNRLCGREVLATAAVRDDGRGRHTTTHRELVLVPGGGLVLDTPGLRELQLWETETGLGDTFADVEALAGQCRFNDCSHVSEPGCAVKRALADGSLAPERFAGYRKLERELEAIALRGDPLARRERLRQIRLEARRRHRPPGGGR